MADFIRPEARAALWQWREVIIAALLGCLGLRWALFSFGLLEWIGWGVIAIAVVYAVISVQRLRFARGGGGVGLVQIRERRVEYLGPVSGALMDLDDLSLLELDHGLGPIGFWKLTDAYGKSMSIPLNAEGADGLFDLFVSLPGLSTEKMLNQMNMETRGKRTIWAVAH